MKSFPVSIPVPWGERNYGAWEYCSIWISSGSKALGKGTRGHNFPRFCKMPSFWIHWWHKFYKWTGDNLILFKIHLCLQKLTKLDIIYKQLHFCISIKPCEKYHKKTQHLVKYCSFYSYRGINIYIFIYIHVFILSLWLFLSVQIGQCIMHIRMESTIKIVLTMINTGKKLYSKPRQLRR